MDMMEITALYSPLPEDRYTTAGCFSLKTKRSPKLGDLTSRFIATSKPFYNCKDLRAHGVDAIALPDICSLSSEGCHFKPLDSLGSITAAYPSIDTHYKVRRPGPYAALDEKPIISCLEPIQYGVRTGLTPSKVIQDNGYWNEIHPICSSKFYQIGVESTKLMNLALEMSSLYEWAGPTPEDGNLSPPHLKIYMATECNGESSILTHCEMGVIMSAFYSRVYEPGYEGHSIFPILIISEYFWRRVRIIEAVFDQPREKFTVKFTPICYFGGRDDNLWNLFLRYEGSEPQY